MILCDTDKRHHNFSQSTVRHRPGGHSYVEVTGMLVGNFLENPKNTQILILNQNTQIAILRAVSGKIKSEFYTLKNTMSIPITLLWKCPPPGVTAT